MGASPPSAPASQKICYKANSKYFTWISIKAIARVSSATVVLNVSCCRGRKEDVSMTPTQARAFLAVAMKGSFSEAARSLGVSQPTVTNQIKQIERRHEVELFYRTGRGASLTQVGEALLP